MEALQKAKQQRLLKAVQLLVFLAYLALKVGVVVLPFLAVLVDLLNLAEVVVLLKGEEERSFL